MTTDKMYTLKEVAELFRVDIQTVRRWTREDKIKSVKIGERLIRIPGKEVKRLLNGD